MDFNFSDLTTSSQRELFERSCAFDAACEWITRFSQIDIASVRATLIGIGMLEGADRDDDEISLFWADMDKNNSELP